jgi:G3E family GTPase
MVKFFILQETDWELLMQQQHEGSGPADNASEGDDEGDDEGDKEGTDQALTTSDPADDVMTDDGSEREEGQAQGDTETGLNKQQQQQQQQPGVSGGAGGSTADQLQAVAAGRRQQLERQFGLVLRSKGFVWLATRGDHIGEWSQAGSLLTFTTGEAGPTTGRAG